MSLVGELLRGMVILSILAVMQHSCTVKEMAKKAAKAHEKGLSPYGKYSRILTGEQVFWAKAKNLNIIRKD